MIFCSTLKLPLIPLERRLVFAFDLLGFFLCRLELLLDLGLALRLVLRRLLELVLPLRALLLLLLDKIIKIRLLLVSRLVVHHPAGRLVHPEGPLAQGTLDFKKAHAMPPAFG